MFNLSLLLFQRKKMKKIILIAAIAGTGLFADAMTDAVVSKAKSEATTKVVEQVAGNDVVKKEIANKVAGAAMTDGLSADKLKDEAMGQAKEKATDMAAEQASKAVGKETLEKETAKSAIKSVI